MEPRGMRRGGRGRGGRPRRGGPMVGLYSTAEEEMPYLASTTKLSLVEEKRMRKDWGYDDARGGSSRGRQPRPSRAGSRFSPYPSPSVEFVPRKKRRGTAPHEPEAGQSVRFEARPYRKERPRGGEARVIESGEIVEAEYAEPAREERMLSPPRRRRQKDSPKVTPSPQAVPEQSEEQEGSHSDSPSVERERVTETPSADPSASPLDLVVDFDDDPEETADMADQEVEEVEQQDEDEEASGQASPGNEEHDNHTESTPERSLKKRAARGRRPQPKPMAARRGSRRRPLPSRDRPMYGDPEDWLPREQQPAYSRPTPEEMYPQPPRAPRGEYAEAWVRRQSADSYVSYRTIPEERLYDMGGRRQYVRSERYYQDEMMMPRAVVVERQVVLADPPPPRERHRLPDGWDNRSPPLARPPPRRWEEPARGGYRGRGGRGGGRGRGRGGPGPRRPVAQAYYSDY